MQTSDVPDSQYYYPAGAGWLKLGTGPEPDIRLDIWPDGCWQQLSKFSFFTVCDSSKHCNIDHNIDIQCNRLITEQHFILFAAFSGWLSEAILNTAMHKWRHRSMLFYSKQDMISRGLYPGPGL